MKKVFRFLSMGLIAGIMTGSFVGCGSASTSDSKKIGMLVSTLDNPFFVSLKEGAEEKAKELGYELVVVDSQNDSSKELSNVEDLLQKGVTALILNPVDSDAATSSVIKANSEDIPVVTVDRQSNGGEVATHIASDNVKGGEMAAEFIKEKLGGTGTIVELQGTTGASATRDRGTGFHNIIDKEDKITIASSQPADFDRQKGLTVTENIIQSNPSIQAIFAHNDEMALGAVKALSAAGVKDCIVVGFDGGEDAINAVDAGEMTATIAQQPKVMGSLAVENAKKASEKETTEKEVNAELKLYTGKNN